MFGSRHSCLEFRFHVGDRTLAFCIRSRCVSVRSQVRSAARSSVHVFSMDKIRPFCVEYPVSMGNI